MAYDSTDGYSLLFEPNGDTWTFARGAWTNLTASLPISPGPRQAAAISDDPQLGGVLLFGGLSPSGGYLSDTWLFSHGTWTKLAGASSSAPPSRSDASMAYDYATGSVVLFGGWDGSQVFSDTNYFSEGQWKATGYPATSPGAYMDAALSFDPLINGLVLFGGWDGGGNRNETWLFSGNSWSNITPRISPGVRGGPSMTFDWLDDYLLLFGGCATSWGGCSYQQDSWIFRNGTWTNITLSLGFKPASDAFAPLFYDGVDAESVLFGRTYYTVNNYTYAYGPSPSPSPRVSFFSNTTGCGSIDLGGTLYSNGENSTLGVGSYTLTATASCAWGTLTRLTIMGYADFWVSNATARIYGNTVILAGVTPNRILSVVVTPATVALRPWQNQTFTPLLTCANGACPPGAIYDWTVTNALSPIDNLSYSTGYTRISWVNVTARAVQGLDALFLNVTILGRTVEAGPMEIHVTPASARFAVTFLSHPTRCGLTFNATGWADGSTGNFSAGSYPLDSGVCSNFTFRQWNLTGGISVQNSTGASTSVAVFGNGTLLADYTWSGGSGPPPAYTLTFQVNPPSCGPVLFNGTAQADGASASFRAGTYPARAPACPGWTFSEWTIAPQTLGTVYFYYTPWANISVNESGALMAFYLPPPLIVSLSANPTSLTAGGGATLTASISGGVSPYTCRWSLNGTNGSQNACVPATFTFAHPGTYTYVVWVTDSWSEVTESNAVAITVSALPRMLVANAGWTPFSPGDCGFAGKVTFWAQPSGGVRPYSFAWNLGDGTTANTQNSTHQYASTGSFSVTFEIADSRGAHDWQNMSVTVTSLTYYCGPGQGPVPAPFPILLILLVVALVAVAVLVPLVLLWRRRRGRGPPPPEPGPAAPQEERPPSP